MNLTIPRWIPIAEIPPYDSRNGDSQRFIVWNGKDDPGEAVRSEDYSWDDDYTDPEPRMRWAWSHRSTCSCCHSYMDPQPTHFTLMLTPPA